MAYLEVHVSQTLRKLDKECRAHVKVELRERICSFCLCTISEDFVRQSEGDIPDRYPTS